MKLIAKKPTPASSQTKSILPLWKFQALKWLKRHWLHALIVWRRAYLGRSGRRNQPFLKWLLNKRKLEFNLYGGKYASLWNTGRHLQRCRGQALKRRGIKFTWLTTIQWLLQLKMKWRLLRSSWNKDRKLQLDPGSWLNRIVTSLFWIWQPFPYWHSCKCSSHLWHSSMTISSWCWFQRNSSSISYWCWSAAWRLSQKMRRTRPLDELQKTT